MRHTQVGAIAHFRGVSPKVAHFHFGVGQEDVGGISQLLCRGAVASGTQGGIVLLNCFQHFADAWLSRHGEWRQKGENYQYLFHSFRLICEKLCYKTIIFFRLLKQLS